MAFRVAITGSSPEQCEKYAHMVNQDGLNIELAGMAYSGTELQGLVFDLRPDVVINELELSGKAVLDYIYGVVLTSDEPRNQSFLPDAVGMKIIYLGISIQNCKGVVKARFSQIYIN